MVNKSMTPLLHKDMNASNVMTVMVDTVKIKSSQVKLDSELYIKLGLGKDSRTLNQKGHTVKDGFSFYKVDEQALFVPGKSKTVSLEIEVFTSAGDSVAKGAIVVDTSAYLKYTEGKWDNAVLQSKLDTGNKNVKLSQNTGEMKIHINVKPEAYWSDSESDNSTCTNSVSTTPGSVLSTSSVTKMAQQYFSGSKNTPKGSASKVTFTSPAKASTAAAAASVTAGSSSSANGKENMRSEANKTTLKSADATSKDAITKASPTPTASATSSAVKLKSALKVSANSSTFTYATTASAPVSIAKEKKEVTVNAISPVKAKVASSSAATATAATTAATAAAAAPVNGMNHAMMLGIAALAFIASLWLSQFLPSATSSGRHLTMPATIRTATGNAIMLYNPAKKIRLVDSEDGMCMSWRWGPMGGKAKFSKRGCNSFWSIRRADNNAHLQLEHANGKCLCPKHEYAASSALKLADCNDCTSGWTLTKDGKLHGGHGTSSISRSKGMFGPAKSEAGMAMGSEVSMVAYHSAGEQGPVQKFVSF
jgi:hypothetical protein